MAANTIAQTTTLGEIGYEIRNLLALAEMATETAKQSQGMPADGCCTDPEDRLESLLAAITRGLGDLHDVAVGVEH